MSGGAQAGVEKKSDKSDTASSDGGRVAAAACPESGTTQPT
jgi:hypothetical protein